MRTELDNGALDHDRHPISLLRRMKPMGDRDNGPPSKDPTQGILH